MAPNEVDHHVTGADPPRDEAKPRHPELDVGRKGFGMGHVAKRQLEWSGHLGVPPLGCVALHLMRQVRSMCVPMALARCYDVTLSERHGSLRVQ